MALGLFESIKCHQTDMSETREKFKGKIAEKKVLLEVGINQNLKSKEHVTSLSYTLWFQKAYSMAINIKRYIINKKGNESHYFACYSEYCIILN